MQVNMLIKNIVDKLVDKLLSLRDVGIDNETYVNLVNNVVIGKYEALVWMLTQFAKKGDTDALDIFLQMSFKEYTLLDILQSISVIESKLILNEQQKEKLRQAREIMSTLTNKGIGVPPPDNTGCLGLLLVLIIPATILSCLIL